MSIIEAKIVNRTVLPFFKVFQPLSFVSFNYFINLLVKNVTLFEVDFTNKIKKERG